MKDFIKATQTMREFMESRGFTLFNGRNSVWVAKFATVENDIEGMDKFIVFYDDLDSDSGEIWEFNQEDREHITDDEIAQMIADVDEARLLTQFLTPISTESYLFSK